MSSAEASIAKELVITAQEKMLEALSMLRAYVDLSGDFNTGAYIVDKLAIMTNSEHDFLTNDPNLDAVIESLTDLEDAEEEERLPRWLTQMVDESEEYDWDGAEALFDESEFPGGDAERAWQADHDAEMRLIRKQNEEDRASGLYTPPTYNGIVGRREPDGGYIFEP